jgi:NAD-dependent DNA ligase
VHCGGCILVQFMLYLRAGKLRCRVAAVLTYVKAVNKTDCTVMGSEFKSLAAMFQATEAQLGALPGLGPTKVKRLHSAFQKPFNVNMSLSASQRQGAPIASSPSIQQGRPPPSAQELREWEATQRGYKSDEESSDSDLPGA